MNVEEFIATYGAGLPAQEITLLRAADAYYKYYYDNILVGDDFDKVAAGWRPVNIQVSPSDQGGSTAGGQGSYTITVPSGDNGANNIPVAGISGWENSTFLIYDSRLALVHELEHVILGLLGISSLTQAGSELMLAALASVGSNAIASADASSPDYLLQVARNVRQTFGLSESSAPQDPATNNPNYATANNPLALTAEVRSNLLSRANGANGSYENIFNQARDFYSSIAGLEEIPAAYRVGYVSHPGQGATDPDGSWKTYGAGEGQSDPGHRETLIQNGIGIAWLGNQYANTMTTGDGEDYIDGGNGNDTLDGRGGADLLLGGAGNDTIQAGRGDDFLEGGAGNDTLNGQENNDIVFGDAGSDRLYGDSGVDELDGGADNDFYFGGRDNDTLTDTSGYDTYYYNSGEGNDIIDDQDGQGIILYNNIALPCGIRIGNGVYRSPDEQFIYRLVIDSASGGLALDVTNVGSPTGGIRILGFERGELGIHLEEGETGGGDLDDIRDPFDEAQCIRYTCPIVLDLDGDGMELRLITDGAYFDHDADGFAESTGWVNPDDGLLVWDRNGDGLINNGRELFGNETLLGDGSRAANGYQAMAELDANADGRLDATDADFAQLRVWRDLDGNGISASDELFTFSALDIVSLNVGFTAPDIRSSNGNEYWQVSQYTRADGSTGETADVWFQADAMYSRAVEELPVSPEIALLPELQGYGEVYSLHQAMARDTGSGLQTLVGQFIAETDPNARTAIVESLLLEWTGSADVVAGSRGGYVNAQHLAILEKFIGEDYAGIPLPFRPEQISANPNPGAGQLLEQAYRDLVELSYVRLMSQSHLSDLYQIVTYDTDATTGETHANFDAVIPELLNRLDADPDAGAVTLAEFSRTLFGLKPDDHRDYGEFRARFADETPQWLWTIDSANRVETIGTGGHESLGGSIQGDAVQAGAGNDSLWGGQGHDVLFGEAGNDTLTGDVGDDLLDGGTGDDSLSGNEGDDTYLFGWGWGRDTIYDDSTRAGLSLAPTGDDYDEIRFGQDVLLEDVTILRDVSNLYLLLQGGDDRLIIEDWFSSPSYRIENLIFSDGTTLDSAYVESVSIYAPRDFTIGGGDIEGTDGDDLIEGTDGNDYIYTGSGNDNIVGGSGNDELEGEEGNDIYLFNPGFGQDYVYDDGDETEIDTFQFGAGISPENLRLAAGDMNKDQDEYSLYITLTNAVDTIVIDSFFDFEYSEIEQFTFFDGTVWDRFAIASRIEFPAPTPGYDDIYGSAGNDTLYGEAGDDSIDAGPGNDTLYGGTGQDYLYGNFGDDVLDGGADTDNLEGAEGSDTYHFNLGSGQDRVDDYSDSGASDYDVVVFGVGIAPDAVSIRRIQEDLVLQVDDTTDSLTIGGYYYVDPSWPYDSKIEEVRFADGTAWDSTVLDNAISYIPTEGTDYLLGTDGNDTLDGLGGDDYLAGGLGNDTYLYRRGSGNDWLYEYWGVTGGADKIQFESDIAPADIVVSRDQQNLYISIAGETDPLVVHNWAYSPHSTVEQFQFADGTVWSSIDIVNNLTPAVGTADNNQLFSGSVGHTIGGYGGDDNLDGGAGDDTLDGGDGDDYLFDPSGYDFLYGGAGDDRIFEYGGGGVVDGGAGNDSLVINNGSHADVLFGRSSGHDTINIIRYQGASATVILDVDISAADITTFRPSTYDLAIRINGSDASLTVTGSPLYPNYYYIGGLPELRFADGTVWDEAALVADLEILSPTSGNDFILGDALDNAIYGDAGDDTLYGEEGNDTLDGGLGSDYLTGNTGDDTLYGGSGDDSLAGSAGNDTLDGGSGSDYLSGDQGNDTYLFGYGYGQDYLNDYYGGFDSVVFNSDVGPGDIRVERGRGYELDGYDINSLILRVNATTDSLVVQNFFYGPEYQIEEVRFSDGTVWDANTLISLVSVITGTSGSDVLRGYHDTDDTVDGLEGDDALYGLAGDDTLTGGLGADNLDGGAGADILSGDDGNDILLGSAGNDTLYGGVGDDRLRGHAGIDVLYGNEGNDVYIVTDGGDLVVEQADEGDDTVDAYIDYVLPEHVERLNLGGGRALQGTGNILDNTLIGNAAGNALSGGNGNDEINGQSGDDTLTGDAGADTLRGSDGNDALDGGTDDDVIIGDAGADTLNGSEGSDVLVGGNGADDLAGGVGSDVYLYNPGDSAIVESDLIREVAQDSSTTDADTLSFGAGLLPEDIYAYLQYTDRGNGEGDTELVLLSPANGDRIRVAWSTTYSNGTELVTDNSYVDRAQFLSPESEQVFDLVGIVNAHYDDLRNASESNPVALFTSSDLQTFDITSQVGIAGGDVARNYAAGGVLPDVSPVLPPPPTANAADNVITGSDAADTLSGLAGEDALVGGAGNDQLVGGTGNDALSGGTGSDTYVFGQGDGVDTITDTAAPGEGNQVVFGDGITQDALSLGLGSLMIRVGNRGDGIRIVNFDPMDPYGEHAVDLFYFSDGTSLTYAELIGFGFDIVGTDDAELITGTNAVDRIEALDGDDRIISHGGNDTINGGAGNDTYVVNRGDGHDVITDEAGNDRIQLNEGIVLSQIEVTRVDDDLVLSYSSSDSLTVRGWFTGQQIEAVELPDGTVYSASEMEARIGMAPPPNGVPFVSRPIDDMSVQAGTVLDFALVSDSFLDPDVGDVLGYSASLADGTDLPDWLSFDPQLLRFAGTPGNGDTGVFSIRVTATDIGGASVSDLFDLAVDAVDVNHAPTVNVGIADQLVSEDETFSLTIASDAFSDQDVGDVLAYSAVLIGGMDLPSWLIFDAFTATFVANPTNADVGVYGLEVTATDTSGSFVSEVFTLTVNNVNDTPVVINPIADQSTDEDALFSFTLDAALFGDDDFTHGDSLSLSVSLADGSDLPSWLAFDADTGSFSGIPTNGDVGSYDLRVTATDESDATASTVFALTVNNTNDAPLVANSIVDQTTNEDSPFSLTLESIFTDDDLIHGDLLTLSAALTDGSILPDWLVFDTTTGTFSGIPDNGDVGTYEIQVTAIDLAGTSASDVFTLTVNNINDNPILANALGDLTADEDVPFSFTVPSNTFFDDDFIHGDSLALTASLTDGSVLPDWLMFDATTGTFSGTPDNGDVGSYDVRITATDTAGTSVFDDFVLTVNNVNDAPILASPIPDQLATEGLAFNYALPGDTFSDDDTLHGDMLSYAATITGGGDLPSWLTFDAATQTFTGTASPDSVLIGTDGDDALVDTDTGISGAWDIQITATDTAGISAADSFTLTLQGVAGNDTLNGGKGNDALNGGAGDDAYFYNPGDGLDTLTDREGEDNVALGTGLTFDNAIIRIDDNTAHLRFLDTDGNEGTEGIDITLNSDGSSPIESFTFEDGSTYTLNDLLIGTQTLYGTNKADTLIGDRNDDTIYAGKGGDSVYGRTGNDTLYGEKGKDYLYGEGGNDALFGDKGDDTLNGGAGDDLLDGGKGHNTLIGGKGNDTLILGKGEDTIRFNLGDGWDTLTSTAKDPEDSELHLGPGITHQNLWFSRTGNDLTLNVLGTQDGMTIASWFTAKHKPLDEIHTDTGELEAKQIERLVQAMASFTPAPGSGTPLPTEMPNELQATLAGAWETGD